MRDYTRSSGRVLRVGGISVRLLRAAGFRVSPGYATKVVKYLDGKMGHNQLTACVEAIGLNFKYTIYG